MRRGRRRRRRRATSRSGGTRGSRRGKNLIQPNRLFRHGREEFRETSLGFLTRLCPLFFPAFHFPFLNFLWRENEVVHSKLKIEFNQKNLGNGLISLSLSLSLSLSFSRARDAYYEEGKKERRRVLREMLGARELSTTR